MFGRTGRATNNGYGRRLWPVFAILVAVVVLPTAGVFWFMNQAMQNEQLAVRQRLTEIYRSQLRSTAAQIQTLWGQKLSVLAQAAKQTTKPDAFASLVKAGHVDSVLFYDNARVIYPELSVGAKISTEPVTSMWLVARRLEYEKNDPQKAAEAYGNIARQSSEDRISALALLAQARCMNKAGQPQSAIETLISTLGADRFRRTADAQGRLIQLNGFLFALELMKGPTHPLFEKTARTLAGHLNEYRFPTMPSSQRRFLMQRLQSLWPDCPSFPTQAAEELAAAFGKAHLDRLRPGQMQATSLKDVWAYQASDKSLIALFHKDHLLTFMTAAMDAQDPIPGISISVHMPGTSGPGLMTEGIGDSFPSWRLTLSPEGPDPFKSASSQKITVYLWTGILMIAGVVVLSLLLAGFLQRQIRLTNLKNDLIANVSHELKTPLASIRLLVDTLRDGRYQDTQLVQDYLQMIAKENARLSSLIEEFLTFSRMERNKAKFDRSHLKIDEIMRAALEALGDRLQSPKCHLHLDLAPELPGVIGDRDALVTVMVNLLDNALKYSGDEKRIQVRSFASNGCVVFEVQDNGIGFPRSAAKKIFDRFYQVDQTLSRRAGGCGLGLSIVQFIVAAHKGSITAKSQPGEGSTFTVQLPAA